MPGAADGYASDDEVTSKPLPHLGLHGYGALEGDRPTRKRTAQEVLEYGVRQGSGLRRPVREMPTGFRPDRLTGAQTRPRLSVEYHKVLLELVKKSKVTCMKSDLTILRENHRFLWDEPLDGSSWEMRMAKRYYDRLFKESFATCRATARAAWGSAGAPRVGGGAGPGPVHLRAQVLLCQR
ncbi:unnamed protein product [Effrenium voratum]|nr:unnamed protein product [Effrenium voratum]